MQREREHQLSHVWNVNSSESDYSFLIIGFLRCFQLLVIGVCFSRLAYSSSAASGGVAKILPHMRRASRDIIDNMNALLQSRALL